jgi:DNA-binding MarR family transcriptional regulator
VHPDTSLATPADSAHAEPASAGAAPPRALVLQANAAFRALHSTVETVVDAAAARYGINRNDQHCLELLDRQGPLSASQLAELAGLSAAAITKVVDRLVAAGYVERTRTATDRRQVIITTTAAEQRLAGEVFGPLVADGMRLLSALSDDQLQLLCDVLARAAAVNTAHAERIRRSSEADGAR